MWALAATTLMAHAADFAGGGTGPIPDNNPAGIDITFNVSGFVQPVYGVRLKLNITHTFVGDLRATLISPAGTARLLVFGRLGSRMTGNAGTSANLGGEYVFDDGGGDLWAAIAPLVSADTVPPGRYRTSTTSKESSSAGLSDHGGCSTSLVGAFGGLTGSETNGIWTLNIADEAGIDTGSVSSALLSLDPVADSIFAYGFEARAQCKSAWLDLTGAGRTSYVLVRNTGGGPTGAITWYVKDNIASGSSAGAITSFEHGVQSDIFLTGDWDGDGIGDAAVWRAGPAAKFIVRPSSHPSHLHTFLYGQTGDDPKHIGDYDGDGLSDFAVYRAGPMSMDPSHTYIHPSHGGPDRAFVTGENGGFPAGGVDYSGDGLADMAIQSNAGGNVAKFRLYNGVTGALFDTINFGTPSDVIEVGNHAGTALSDITVIRGIAGEIVWTTRDGDTGVGQPSVNFGTSATDFPLSGDYDGDGLDDYAFWRPNADPALCKFSIRRSTAPGTPIDIFLGQNGDYPVGNTRSH
jgi:subtilisin-like proprotein convertase family protein